MMTAVLPMADLEVTGLPSHRVKTICVGSLPGFKAQLDLVVFVIVSIPLFIRMKMV
jgi:hypothetical protein